MTKRCVPTAWPCWAACARSSWKWPISPSCSSNTGQKERRPAAQAAGLFHALPRLDVPRETCTPHDLADSVPRETLLAQNAATKEVPMPSPDRLVILDRDGVINRDSDDYVKSLAEWVPYPSAIDAIARLSHAGWTVAVATNQSGIARGYYDRSEERRVGKECRSRWAPHQTKRKERVRRRSTAPAKARSGCARHQWRALTPVRS